MVGFLPLLLLHFLGTTAAEATVFGYLLVGVDGLLRRTLASDAGVETPDQLLAVEGPGRIHRVLPQTVSYFLRVCLRSP